MMSAEIFNKRSIARGASLYSSLLPDNIIGEVRDQETQKKLAEINAEAQKDFYRTTQGAQRDFYENDAKQDLDLIQSRKFAGNLAGLGTLAYLGGKYAFDDPLELPKPVERKAADYSGVESSLQEAVDQANKASEDLAKLTSNIKAGVVDFNSTGSGTNTDTDTTTTTAPVSSKTNPSDFSGGFKTTYDLAVGAGFKPEDAKIMAAIAGGESSYDPGVRNSDASGGDDSYGYWQINMLGDMGPERRKLFGISSNDQLYDPKINAAAAKKIFDQQGFGAWTVYNTGKYKEFLQ